MGLLLLLLSCVSCKLDGKHIPAQRSACLWPLRIYISTSATLFLSFQQALPCTAVP